MSLRYDGYTMKPFEHIKRAEEILARLDAQMVNVPASDAIALARAHVLIAEAQMQGGMSTMGP